MGVWKRWWEVLPPARKILGLARTANWPFAQREKGQWILSKKKKKKDIGIYGRRSHRWSLHRWGPGTSLQKEKVLKLLFWLLFSFLFSFFIIVVLRYGRYRPCNIKWCRYRPLREIALYPVRSLLFFIVPFSFSVIELWRVPFLERHILIHHSSCWNL